MGIESQAKDHSRSKTKQHELATLLTTHHADVAVVSEVDLEESVKLAIPGYSFIPAASDTRGYVRLCLLLRKSLTDSITTLSRASSDVWISIFKDVAVGDAYRLWKTLTGEAATMLVCWRDPRTLRPSSELLCGQVTLIWTDSRIPPILDWTC